MPFVRSRGADIYWKAEGEEGKPSLVLLNSIGTDMHLWAEAIAPLRRHFSLLRIDARGHGASDAPGGDYGMVTLAQDVRAAMDAAHIEVATIAGVSLGGMMAMQLALDAPARVNGLALCCTSATIDRQAWAMRVEAVRTGGLKAIADLAMTRFLSPEFTAASPEVSATIRRGLLAMDPAGYAGCAAAIRDMALADRLGDIACPVLVVTGHKDVSTPFEGHSDVLLERISDARHQALDAAHLAPLDAPDGLAAAIVTLNVRIP